MEIQRFVCTLSERLKTTRIILKEIANSLILEKIEATGV